MEDGGGSRLEMWIRKTGVGRGREELGELNVGVEVEVGVVLDIVGVVHDGPSTPSALVQRGRWIRGLSHGTSQTR